MLGTKCPSMTATWTTLPPPSPAARTCSPRREKSAERIDGASSIKRVSQPEICSVKSSQGAASENSNTVTVTAQAVLRTQRGYVGGDRLHIVKSKPGDDYLHLSCGNSGARTAFHVVELADDIARRAACQSRYF